MHEQTCIGLTNHKYVKRRRETNDVMNKPLVVKKQAEVFVYLSKSNLSEQIDISGKAE